MIEQGSRDQSMVGHDDLLGELFREHYLSLVKLAVQLVDDHSSAEDVVQDVFGRLQRGDRDIRRIADARRYLATAVVNQARSVLRQRRSLRSRMFDRPQRIEDAETEVIRDATSAAIWCAITRLPPRQRQVVALHYYEDWSISEIATALEISAGAVASSLDRARKSLAKSVGVVHAEY